MGVYQRRSNLELGWDVEGVENLVCFDFDLSVCAPWSDGVDVTQTNAMTTPAAVACADACEALDLGFEPVISSDPNDDSVTWDYRSTECIFLVEPPSPNVPAELGAGPHGCPGVEPGVPQLEVDGACDAPAGETTACPIGTACGDWLPQRNAYFSGAHAVVDVDFFHGVDFGQMFACDAPSFVYSSDGTGHSKVDGLDPSDLLDEIGLKNGDYAFEIRQTSPRATGWYGLDTFDEILDAFDNVMLAPGSAGTFEVRYVDGARLLPRTRTVDIKQCGEVCDRHDL